jgi:RNA-directed DNA polymerase
VNQQFNIASKRQLCELLRIVPGELDYVLWRIKQNRAYRLRPKTKPDGSIRSCQAPIPNLKNLQRKIKQVILDKVPLAPSAYGGIRGRSCIQHAKIHTGKKIVIVTDLEKCFPSIKTHHISGIFEGLGFSDDALKILVRVCSLRHELPQGAPTSPVIANIVLRRLDVRLDGLAKQQTFNAGRFIDDIGISGTEKLGSFLPLIQKIIETEGFRVQSSKTRVMKRGSRQLVTKLIVNEKVNLPREQIIAIRQRIMSLRPNSTTKEWETVSGKVYWANSVNQAVGSELVRMYKDRREQLLW